MKLSRCIYLKPEHPQLHSIQSLRQTYDPLVDKVPPHVTVVFPFSIEWGTEQIISAMEQNSCRNEIPFSLAAPIARENYLFFPLDKGRQEVAEIYKSLYAQLPLESKLDTYLPHITFAHLEAGQDPEPILKQALSIWSPEMGLIKSLVLETIAEDEASITEYEKPLMRLS